MRRHEVLLGVAALGDRESAALLAVVVDAGPHELGLVERRPVDLARGADGVVDLGTVDLLECLHRGDRARELQVGVLRGEVVAKVERERSHAAARHEVAHLQAHAAEVVVGEREGVLRVLDAEHGVDHARAPVGAARRHADADHGRLREALAVRVGVEEVLEDLSVQDAEVLGHRETLAAGVGRGQDDAEVVVAQVRREVVADDAAVALAGARVDDAHVEHLDDGELLVIRSVSEAQVHRDDVELDAVPVGVSRDELVQPVVHHRQGVAEVLLTARAARQVGEVGRDARGLGGGVVLVETGGGDAERDVVRHDGPIGCGGRVGPLMGVVPSCAAGSVIG